MTASQDVEEAKENAHTIYNIALVKSYAYCDEYNTATGRTEERNGARFLKEGYVDGFLAGFTYKITGEES
jgi:RimJ/RimL family protein N-acetyltransferase